MYQGSIESRSIKRNYLPTGGSLAAQIQSGMRARGATGVPREGHEARECTDRSIREAGDCLMGQSRGGPPVAETAG
jgi:hypothetical protein